MIFLTTHAIIPGLFCLFAQLAGLLSVLIILGFFWRGAILNYLYVFVCKHMSTGAWGLGSHIIGVSGHWEPPDAMRVLRNSVRFPTALCTGDCSSISPAPIFVIFKKSCLSYSTEDEDSPFRWKHLAQPGTAGSSRRDAIYHLSLWQWLFFS